MGTKSANGLTSLQCRMARAGLQWGMRELAEAARVSTTAIMRLELGRGRPNHSTQAALRTAFEAAGVEFFNGNGVRIKTPVPPPDPTETS